MVTNCLCRPTYITKPTRCATKGRGIVNPSWDKYIRNRSLHKFSSSIFPGGIFSRGGGQGGHWNKADTHGSPYNKLYWNHQFITNISGFQNVSNSCRSPSPSPSLGIDPRDGSEVGVGGGAYLCITGAGGTATPAAVCRTRGGRGRHWRQRASLWMSRLEDNVIQWRRVVKVPVEWRTV